MRSSGSAQLKRKASFNIQTSELRSSPTSAIEDADDNIRARTYVLSSTNARKRSQSVDRPPEDHNLQADIESATDSAMSDGSSNTSLRHSDDSSDGSLQTPISPNSAVSSQDGNSVPSFSQSSNSTISQSLSQLPPLQSLTPEDQAKFNADIRQAWRLKSENDIKANHKLVIEASQVDIVLAENTLHVDEENIQIMAMVAGACSSFPDTVMSRPRAMFWEYDTNKTIYQTGKHLLNTDFLPKKFAFLKNSKDRMALFLDNLSLKENQRREFIRTDATIYFPECYTSDHSHDTKALNTIIGNFINEGVKEVIVYLGRDAGNEENIKKRAEWLEKSNPTLAKLMKYANSKGLVVKIVTEPELKQSPQYKMCETYFVTKMLMDPDVLPALQGGLTHDVLNRLRQKRQLLVSPKPTALKPIGSPHSSPQKKKPHLSNNNSNGSMASIIVAREIVTVLSADGTVVNNETVKRLAYFQTLVNNFENKEQPQSRNDRTNLLFSGKALFFSNSNVNQSTATIEVLPQGESNNMDVTDTLVENNANSLNF